MSEYVIRKGKVADLKAVSKLLGEVWHHTYDDIFGKEQVSVITSKWHSVEALETNLEKENSIFLVSEKEQEIVATAYAIFDDDKRVISLSRIYVSPKRQGGGQGAALLKKVCNSFERASEIVLEVEPSNGNAIKFYEKHGFVFVGTGTDCGVAGSGIVHNIMKKQLSA